MRASRPRLRRPRVCPHEAERAVGSAQAPRLLIRDAQRVVRALAVPACAARHEVLEGPGDRVEPEDARAALTGALLGHVPGNRGQPRRPHAERG